MGTSGFTVVSIQETIYSCYLLIIVLFIIIIIKLLFPPLYIDIVNSQHT